MKRNILAIGFAVAALALLGTLVLQSRPVPVDVRAAHHAAIAELERTAEDFNSLVTGLNSAWASAQGPGEGVRALAARMTESPERLSTQLFQINGGTSQENRVVNRYESYAGIVGQTEFLIADLFAAQAAYLESVAFMRETGPQIIRQIRGARLDRAAAETSQLVAGTLDYSTADASVQEAELRLLLVSLSRDQRVDANMPKQMPRLLDSVTMVLDNKSIIQSKVTQIGLIPILDNVHSLMEAQEDLYRSALISIDQGRTLLSIYVVLLLAAAGFVVFRLKQSNR